MLRVLYPDWMQTAGLRVAARLIQRNGLSHASRPNQHHAPGWAPQAEALEPYPKVFPNLIPAGEFRRPAPGARSIWVLNWIHARDSSAKLSSRHNLPNLPIVHLPDPPIVPGLQLAGSAHATPCGKSLPPAMRTSSPAKEAGHFAWDGCATYHVTTAVTRLVAPSLRASVTPRGARCQGVPQELNDS